MKKETIAAQLYTLRDYLGTPELIESTLEAVRDMGYRAVQVSGVGPIDPGRLKDIVDRLGLKICITHTSPVRLRQELELVIREHKLWNCRYVGIGAMPEEYRFSLEGIRAFAAEFSEIGKRLADSGLGFAYHNHNFEFQKYSGTNGMDILIQETDPRYFQFILDTYWVQAGGSNPCTYIKKLKGRLPVIHLKDMAMDGWKQEFAEIGEGNLEWEEILKACEETGVEWYAVEQDICRRNPFDSLKMSLEYLEKWT